MMRRALVLALLASAAVLAGAACPKEDTRVVIFMSGVYTSLSDEGQQSTALEPARFDAMKAGFLARGYEASDLLDFSYNGGEVDDDGAWHPEPYPCEVTDRAPELNIAPLEQMLRDYREAHADAHFTLIGHSHGGYIAFLAGARDAARPEGERLGIDVVVTLDAPLKGVSADKKIVIDVAAPCEKTYIAGGDLVSVLADPATPATRSRQMASMAASGIRVATFGNSFDCLYNTNHCTGGGFIDDSHTQFLPGEASVSRDFMIDTNPFLSHEIIAFHAQVVQAVTEFVGAD